MTNWIEAISKVMGQINAVWDKAKRQVLGQLGLQDPLKILPYRGYGSREQLYLKGRVLQKEGIESLSAKAPVWKNLQNMYRRFESDEIPQAKLQACVAESQQTATANAEGFFEVELKPSLSATDAPLWQSVDLRLLDPPARKSSAVTATGTAIVVSETAQFGVISDIDDTVVYTGATELLKMIRIAYLGNEHSRRAFAGVAPFYQALQQAEQAGNPIFYISSSPWNMYDLFEKFMDLNQIPAGPILLRDIELSPANLLSFEHQAHKREQIDPILQRFSQLPFILIGDSGQQDAEIYAQMVQDYPGRILGIYIRNVTSDDAARQQQLATIAQQVRANQVEFELFPETVAAAKHAAAQGWIDHAAIAAIETDTGV
ncbi:MAG: DUF2183 domain-containing protein [Leptolyngbya sp. SIO4C1]|nr:DUF2183 domain-containing protein [Leptolyngbya sp. SIO4C1]